MMNHPCFNQAMSCARVKDLDGLKRALKQFPEVKAGPSSMYISNIVMVAMQEGWASGLDAVLGVNGSSIHACMHFPNSAVRDGLPALLKHNGASDMKFEDTMGVLSKYVSGMSPQLKADMAFEVGPYIKEPLYERCRAVGLMDASRTDSISHRLAGASVTNEAHPERVASFIAEMPPETKAKLYNAYFTNDKQVKAFSKEFLKGVLDDPAFFSDKNVNDKKFKIDKEFINDPDFSAALMKKGMLDPDRAFTAFWRNPDHAGLAQELAVSLASHSRLPGGVDTHKHQGWLNLVSESLSNSSDPSTRQNAVRVGNQLKQNLGLPVQDIQMSHRVA
jgi:hypothetical protein